MFRKVKGLGLRASYLFLVWKKGVIMGLHGDNGKENGNYYSIIGYILGS